MNVIIPIMREEELQENRKEILMMRITSTKF